MSTTLEPDASVISPVPPPPEPVDIPEAAPPVQEAEEKQPFSYIKAINYSIAAFGANVFFALFNYAMPLYLNAYHLQPWLIGLLANERSFVGAFAQPIVGRISDRTRTPLGRRRPFFLIGIPLVCLGLFLLAAHPEFWTMIAIVSVLAFFLAVAWDPYMALMADVFPERHRGRVGGLQGVWVALGTILLAVIAMQLWEKQEYLVFMLVIGILLLTWGYTFFTIKEPPLPPLAEGTAPREKKPFRRNPWPAIVNYTRGVLRYPEAAKYVLAVNFFWLGTGGVAPFITLFGIKVLHITESEAFILPIAATVAGALTAVPWGIMADRTSKKLVMMIAMTAFGIIAIFGSQAATLWQGVAALALAGACQTAMSQINPMLTDLVPKKRMAEFVGLGSAVFSIAQPIGSVLAGLVVLVAGWMFDETGAYRMAFVYAGVMLIVAALLLRLVHPERANRDD